MTKENSSTKAWYKSKKFWISLVGIIGMITATYFDVSEDIINNIGYIIITYIFGQSAIDASNVHSGNKYNNKENNGI